MNFKKTLKHTIPLLLAGGLLAGCGESANSPLPANITINNATLQKVIGSIIDTMPYSIDMQGVIDASGLTVTVPYTVVNAPVTLPAYTTTFTIDSAHTEDDEVDIVATFSWIEQADLPVGQGTFTATITIDDSNAGIPDGTYYAKKLDIQDDIAGVVAATFPYPINASGRTGTLTLKILPGIPDRMFGKPDNTGNNGTHDFLYLPITNTTTGKTWLNNNLGANYANKNSPVFNIEQQATASNDYNAYGSLFQWGRKADGHELITWTNGSMGKSVNGTTTVQNDDPTDALAILGVNDPYDWRVHNDHTLWANEASANNVCPAGYRVPTGNELDSERASWESNTPAGALASALILPLSGMNDGFDAGLANEGDPVLSGTVGLYWGSTVSATFGRYAQFLLIEDDVIVGDNYRSNGYSVRCIKD